MAWPVSTRATDDLITAAIWNADIAGNMNALEHLIARKTADQNTTSTTLANDDTLFTPSIGANEIWRLTLILSVITGAGGLKSAWAIPTSSEVQRLLTGESASVATFVQQARQTASDTPTLGYLANIAAARLYVEEVLFINAGTAGAVTFRFAQNTGPSGTSTVKANSTLWGVKLA